MCLGNELTHFLFDPILIQVCSLWRDVLYDDCGYWHGLVPVIYCNELRRLGSHSPADSDVQSRVSPSSPSPTASEKTELDAVRSSLYLSLETRGFDSICLFGATDLDVIDFASKISPTMMRRVVSGSLRCSSVSDKGLEIFLAALNQSLVSLELSGKRHVE